MGVYTDTLAHLLAEMERIDLLLRAQVVRARELNTVDERFQGLYISEDELNRLLAKPNGVPPWAFDSDSRRAQVADSVERLQQDTARTVDDTLRGGTALRLPRLADLYGLDAFAIDSLLICLAPELDLRYERIYAYLHDDVTKKKPSVDLVLGLLSPTPRAKLLGRFRFADDAPLIRHHLLEFVEDPSQVKQPLLARQLRIDDRIASYLLGSDGVDARIRPYSQTLNAERTIDELPLDVEMRNQLRGFTQDRTEDQLIVVYLQGPYGAGKRTVAHALCGEPLNGMGGRRPVLEIDLEKLLAGGEGTFASAIELVHREATLQGAALVFSAFDQLVSDTRKALLDEFVRSLEGHPRLVVLSGELAWEPRDALRGTSFIRIEMPRPSASRRAELWSAALNGDGESEHIDVKELATKFRFSGGQIHDAVDTARNLARWRAGMAAPMTTRDIYEACRRRSNQKLASLSRKITPRYQWRHIVLPASRVQQLRDVCDYVKYREQVFGQWGFGRKSAYGNGLSSLFSGPSGTGKTMAAEIIAGELGLDLYKIDLSIVVSKFIGETEKNLSKIFSEAETSNAILFFDEADALFGKRSEVKDAHDRYANIEVGYLLQRIEEYDGIVILATNLRKNIDEAFVRRLQFTIEFPFPNVAERRRLWEVVWPSETPRDPAIDFDGLAERYEITGGSVRNIALAAAFLAAHDGRPVSMDHLLRATQRELQKMGKIIAEGDFEPQVVPPRPGGSTFRGTQRAS
jgi:SpoVK/Ycf46/Vps4 family AAA+-type ATPase